MKPILTVALMLGALSAAAEWESWLKASQYSVSFESCAVNEKLSDKGAQGGTWGDPAVQEGDDAYIVQDATTKQKCLFSSTGSKGVVFTPTVLDARRVKSVQARVLLKKYAKADQLPDLTGARAGLAVCGGSTYSFVGWSASGWQTLTLPSGAVTPDASSWYTVSLKFMPGEGGALRVQYRLGVNGGYEALQNAAGETWLAAGGASDGAVVNSVEFRGDTSLEYLKGSEPRRGMFVSVLPQDADK